jgi:hypothetical protein
MKRLTSVIIISLFVLVSGCASRAAFIYKHGEIVNTNNKKAPVKVAVLPFEDMRGDNNMNSVLLYLIPLMPFGTIEYDRPEAASGFLTHAAYNFRPSEDIAKALVEEMKQNNLFDEVFFTQREKEPGVDMVVTGKIREIKYSGKLYSYGFSVYGPNLWFFGFPSGSATNAVNFTIELKRLSDGAIVWRHNVIGEWSETMGLYYNWGTEFNGFSTVIRDGLVDGMKKLSNEVSDKGKFASKP